MRVLHVFFLGIFLLVVTSSSVLAQVIIDVPANNIFSHTEFLTVKTVMNTQGSKNWRAGAINPSIWALDNEYFSHNTIPNNRLPTSVLQWRLASIGGETPKFYWLDSWPSFKWFIKSAQTWYHPAIGSTYTPGNVDFTFKMPTEAFSNNSFVAGNYSLSVSHNYGNNGFYTIEFSPDNLQVIIAVPYVIQWISNTSTKYIDITSLNSYRQTGEKMIGELGTSIVGNTIPFNILAKSAVSNIQFTSSKGMSATRPISLIKLSSPNSKIITSALSSSWTNHSPSNNFKVEIGNRNDFKLQLSITEADFKNQFFEAGIYKFQLNLDAKSTDNNISAIQNTDITLKVPPLSEITIPTSGNAVNFEFNTFSHYNDGQTKLAPNQIKISNNETYELYVKTDASHFRRSGVQSDVPSSILQVGIDGGSQNVSLSNTSQKIISNGSPVLDKNLNIKYTISPAAAKTLVAKEKSTYSINVIYSFTAL